MTRPDECPLKPGLRCARTLDLITCTPCVGVREDGTRFALCSPAGILPA